MTLLPTQIGKSRPSGVFGGHAGSGVGITAQSGNSLTKPSATQCLSPQSWCTQVGGRSSLVQYFATFPSHSPRPGSQWSPKAGAQRTLRSETPISVAAARPDTRLIPKAPRKRHAADARRTVRCESMECRASTTVSASERCSVRTPAPSARARSRLIGRTTAT